MEANPNPNPNATPAEVEDAIVWDRTELADAGEFNGPLQRPTPPPRPERPHPATVFTATVKARPADRPPPRHVQTYPSRVSTISSVDRPAPSDPNWASSSAPVVDTPWANGTLLS